MSATTNSPGQPNPQYRPDYLPSVPISVYRQLSQELQHTKEQLTQAQAEQTELQNQNQALRQELRSIAEINQELQQVVFQSANQVQAIGQRHQAKIQTLLNPSPPPAHTPATLLNPSQSVPKPPATPPIASTQPSTTTLSSADNETSINGWWLALTMILIVLISFGAGHFLVKSLINRN